MKHQNVTKNVVLKKKQTPFIKPAAYVQFYRRNPIVQLNIAKLLTVQLTFAYTCQIYLNDPTVETNRVCIGLYSSSQTVN